MKRVIPGWMALLLVAGLYGISLAPAHAEGACNPGDRLLDSKILTEAGKKFRVDTCVHTPGPWSQGEFDHVAGLLKALPDTPAKAWVMKNVTFVRVRDEAKVPVCMIGTDGVKRCLPAQMPSPWAGLVDEQGRTTANFVDGHPALFFNGRFFSENALVQRALITFESGKAFYLKQNLGSRFSPYSAAMDEMIDAGGAAGEPNDDRDTPSQFGGLFRIEMLGLSSDDTHPTWKEPLGKLDAMLRKAAAAP